MALNNKNFRRKDRKDICTKVCPELFRKPNNWDHGIDIATNISGIASLVPCGWVSHLTFFILMSVCVQKKKQMNG